MSIAVMPAREIDGDRLIITGMKEVRNASEIAFNLNEMALLSSYVRSKQGKPCQGVDSGQSADDVWNTIDQHFSFAKRVLTQIGFNELQDAFKSLAPTEKEEAIVRILALVNATQNMVDLSLLGGPKYAGCMRLTYSKLLSDPNVDFYIIDQSVTGMFERRMRVGL